MIIPRAKSVDVKPLDPKTLNPEQTKLFNHLPKGELPDYPKVQGVLPELAAVLPTPDELQTLANNTVLTADFTQRLAPVRVLLQRMFIHPEQWNQRDFDVAVRVSQTFFKYSAVQSSHDHIVKMYARDYVGAAETVDELIARWNVMKELTAKYGTNEDPSFANPNNVVIDLRDAVQRFATKVPGEQEKKALYDELEKAGFPARTIRLLREDLYRR